MYPNFNLPHQFSKLCWQRVPGTSGGHCHDLGKSARTDCFLTSGASATAPKHAVEQPEKTRGRATGKKLAVEQPEKTRSRLLLEPRYELSLVSSTVPRRELYLY